MGNDKEGPRGDELKKVSKLCSKLLLACGDENRLFPAVQKMKVVNRKKINFVAVSVEGVFDR